MYTYLYTLNLFFKKFGLNCNSYVSVLFVLYYCSLVETGFTYMDKIQINSCLFPEHRTEFHNPYSLYKFIPTILTTYLRHMIRKLFHKHALNTNMFEFCSVLSQRPDYRTNARYGGAHSIANKRLGSVRVVYYFFILYISKQRSAFGYELLIWRAWVNSSRVFWRS